MIALSDRDLLNRLDGRTVRIGEKMVTLHTKNAVIEPYEMSTLDEVLSLISDPTIAYLMMMLGFFGVLFELFNPGAILPGVIGGISLILAFYAMRTLPVNYAGLALIIFGVILLLLELKIVSHGILAGGGIISLLLGSLMLIKASSPLELASISRVAIVVTTILSGLFFLLVLGAGLKAQKRKPVIGLEAMIGQTGVALEALNPAGRVQVLGEVWNAAAVQGQVAEGERIKIVAINKLVLTVEKTFS